jgi:Tol biopolymer transport system component
MSHSRSSRYTAVAALLLAGLVLIPATAGAQYFGRNKVQYKNFDFKILKTEHFDVYFYMDREAANQAARMAERWYARHSRFFNHELKGRQPLILYASSNEFQQTTVLAGLIGEGTGGVTESFKRRIVLPVGISPAETDHVIGHELVHAFQYDIARGPRMGGGQPAADTGMAVERLPLWLIEGMAEYLSIGPIDPNTAMWMRDAVERKDIPDIKKLGNSYRYFPYRWGQALLSYIGGRWGDETIARIMTLAARTGEYQPVVEKVLGISIKQLSADWKDSLIKAYQPLTTLTQLQTKDSQAVVKGSEMNVYNISPILSPDGKEFMFFSTRDLFSIDLFMGDPKTGKVTTKLTNTAVNPRFESLMFIYSAGAWSLDGSRYAFSAVSKGEPILTVYDVRSKKFEHDIVFPQLGEIFYPTWAPDGRRVAFSALENGVCNLYIYDLETKALKKMTDDAFAELHPAWSPDGRSIAFVTDRFTTDLSILSVGNYELALMDPETGEIRRVEAFGRAENINPQWSPDSRSLYFLSDQSGIPNIYRIDLETRQLFQITNLFTGVSGITSISPAFSVAEKSGRLMFSAYEKGRFSVYSIEAPATLAGQPVTPSPFGDCRPAVLPPMDRQPGLVLGLLRNPIFGLPEAEEFPVSEYKPKLSLDMVSTPQVAVGADRFGTYTGGGITLYWSDMLGTHSVATMAQVNSRIQDSVALVGYQNSQHRLNWGAVVERIPYVYGAYGYYEDIVLDEPAAVEQEIIYRQIFYEASGFLSYPFSQVQRVEFGGGFNLIDFQSELRTYAYSLIDGATLINEKTSLPSPASIAYGFARTALVYDSALFGATGPIIGQSYLLEVEPMVGNLTYTSLMADYRRYFIPLRPFTLAFRMLHYGRYGKNADDERLYPIYLGYDGLVRGYDYSSFDYNEFEGDKAFDFNRLLGSKIMILNAELRFPLFGLFGIGRGYYGVFPVDFLAFYDMGWAWQSGVKPNFLASGGVKPVRSYGIGLRINLFGYLVAGFNYVKPLDRPLKGWHFEFSLMPGF